MRSNILQRSMDNEEAKVAGPTLMLAKPQHFPQNALGCWASAIAAWRLVKGIDTGITDQTLFKSYEDTGCIDSSNALVGDADADIEAVFAEWRLQINLSAEIPEASFTFHFIKSLIENHGHFVMATGDKSLMHAMVVYGVRWNNKSDSSDFTLFVEDPIASDNEKHAMLIERPIRIALGTEKSGGPAPCRTK